LSRKSSQMIEIKKFVYTDQELFKIAIKIRKEVFVIGQNIDPTLECDENEETAIHYLLTENGIPVGAARRRETAKGIKLERFAILPDYRNKGLGNILLDKVLQDVKPLNKLIYLHSQINAASLYLRNGFIAIGEHFYEAGIEHIYMEYQG
jgi:predicted GNAT family N-acyltransferase